MAKIYNKECVTILNQCIEVFAVETRGSQVSGIGKAAVSNL